MENPDDTVCELLSMADKLTILTLFAPAHVLRDRLMRRELPQLRWLLCRGRFRRSLSVAWRIRWRRRVYVNSQRLLLVCGKWMDFCDSLTPEHHWVMNMTTDEPKLVCSAHWRDLHDC